MPQMPKKLCAAPGCGNLVQAGYCPDHTGEPDRFRGSASQRGYKARHRRWRKMVIARDPVCVRCKEYPSTIADHVRPLRTFASPDEPEAWTLENGQGMCQPCHNEKTREDALRWPK